jgi:hypothetical protein
MKKAREQRKSPVKFYASTIARCRTKEGAQMRNPPSFVHKSPDRSQAVRSEVEAVIQQWADDDQ